MRTNSCYLSGVVGIVSIHHHTDLVEIWNHALEYLQTLADQLRRIHRGAGHVGAGTVETLHKSEPNWIVDGEHYDWNVGGCLCSSNSCWRIGGQDDGYFVIYKLGHQTLIISIKNAFAIFNPNILAFNISKLDQAFFEYVKPIGICVLGSRIA